jgi:hypothetical protein
MLEYWDLKSSMRRTVRNKGSSCDFGLLNFTSKPVVAHLSREVVAWESESSPSSTEAHIFAAIITGRSSLHEDACLQPDLLRSNSFEPQKSNSPRVLAMHIMRII